jgi:hypothetical protein
VAQLSIAICERRVKKKKRRKAFTAEDAEGAEEKNPGTTDEHR